MKQQAENIDYGSLFAGAMVGLALLYVTHPRHGERRRASLKQNCAKFGRGCQKTWVERLMAWRPRATETVSDFQAEIRARAPQYLQ